MASGVAGFAVFAGLILVLAAVVSRLLGVRFSVGRAVLTGWAGLAAGFGVGYLVTRRQPGITPLVVVRGGGDNGADRGSRSGAAGKPSLFIASR